MRTRLRLAKNALANLVRGGTAGLVSLLLPAILIRHMSRMDYTVWVLVLQVAAYSSYIDFGLQTAVGRYIAVSVENKDNHQRDSIFSTAFVGLGIASALAIAALIVATVCAGVLFPNVPHELLPSMRTALLIVGSSIALGLPSSAWSGVFVGIQRNELSAAVVGSSKLLSASGLVVAALHGSSLVTMAFVVAAVNAASYGTLYLMVKRFSEVRFRLSLVKRSTAKDLLKYCFSLSIWSFSTLLVSGLDILLVGRFELEALIPYALASSLTSFISGLQSAVFGATMPHAAVLHARGDSDGLGTMVMSTTRLAVLLLTTTSLPILIYAKPLFRTWVGQPYALEGQRLLLVLMAANMIRLVGLPYSIVLVASAQQRLVTLSPLLEGVSNLLVSLFLGLRFGAIGVAAGTLVGGIIGMLGHIIYNMPRTRKEASFPISAFLLSSVLMPGLTATPLIALLVYSYRMQTTTWLSVAACILTLGLVGVDLLKTGISTH